MSETRGTFMIDGHSLLFRAHYAFFRNPLRNSRGMDTSAVFGFMNMILPLFEREAPRYALCAFDVSGHTFRNDLYSEYKANRGECPTEIIEQTPYARSLIQAMNLPVVELEGFEADDLLGTLAKRFATDEHPVTIVTGDRDALQLVDGKVRVMLTKSGIRETVLYTKPEEVERDLGVPPEKVPDLKGLQGDSSDNIPGVPGVGPKTAIKLLTAHGDLEGIYEALPDMKKSKMKERLEENRELAFLSRQLGKIDCAVDFPLTLAECERGEYDRERLLELVRELELTRIAKMIQVEDRADDADYQLVTTEAELDACLKELAAAEEIGVDTETTSQHATRADLVGVSLSAGGRKAWYIPVAHQDERPQLAWETVREKLRPLLGEGGKPSIGQNLQYDWLVLDRHGLRLGAVGHDTMVGAYVLNPTRRRYDLKTLALEELGWTMKTFAETVPKGGTFDQVPLDDALGYAAADAEAAFELCALQRPALEEAGLQSLYGDLELPLVPLLARMQKVGIRVLPEKLAEISGTFTEEIDGLEAKAHELAGREFNVNSPSQLATVLFEELGFQPVKKTKTGYSTDSGVLAQLAAYQGCELAKVIDRYRHLAKLRSTYLEALPKEIHPDTGRIHASFNQTVAATGRISSSDPNLQNIPVKTAEGRRIREAFVPAEGKVFVAADYSQIELRIMAHMSGSKVLREAFEEGEDVHTRTAAEVFEVDLGEVDSTLRDRAKAINFGLIYGQSAHGLSQQLLISRGEAQEFIESYFGRLPEVKEFIEHAKLSATEKGYAETLLGRRRAIPELQSAKGSARGFAERIAVNTPIQGSAADLIKRAMLGVDEALAPLGDAARVVLQIHDELIVECEADKADEVADTLRRVMEGAMELSVPVVVSVGRGETWAALK